MQERGCLNLVTCGQISKCQSRPVGPGRYNLPVYKGGGTWISIGSVGRCLRLNTNMLGSPEDDSRSETSKTLPIVTWCGKHHLVIIVNNLRKSTRDQSLLDAFQGEASGNLFTIHRRNTDIRCIYITLFDLLLLGLRQKVRFSCGNRTRFFSIRICQPLDHLGGQ